VAHIRHIFRQRTCPNLSDARRPISGGGQRSPGPDLHQRGPNQQRHEPQLDHRPADRRNTIRGVRSRRRVRADKRVVHLQWGLRVVHPSEQIDRANERVRLETCVGRVEIRQSSTGIVGRAACGGHNQPHGVPFPHHSDADIRQGRAGDRRTRVGIVDIRFRNWRSVRLLRSGISAKHEAHWQVIDRRGNCVARLDGGVHAGAIDAARARLRDVRLALHEAEHSSTLKR